MEDLIKEVFKEYQINFDSEKADYVDDSFSNVKDAILEIIEKSKEL